MRTPRSALVRQTASGWHPPPRPPRPLRPGSTRRTAPRWTPCSGRMRSTRPTTGSREIERGTVTPAMKRIEAEDPERRLAGLEHSLKGKDRLTQKIDQWMSAQANLTAADAFSAGQGCDPLYVRVRRNGLLGGRAGGLRSTGVIRVHARRPAESWEADNTRESTADGGTRILGCSSKCSSIRRKAWMPRS